MDIYREEIKFQKNNFVYFWTLTLKYSGDPNIVHPNAKLIKIPGDLWVWYLDYDAEIMSN